MVPAGMFRGLPHQDDEIHLTPDGYHALAMELAPQVASALSPSMKGGRIITPLPRAAGCLSRPQLMLYRP